jgi:hypothetical protein
MTPHDVQLYLPVVIVVAVIALRWRRMMRPQRLRIAALLFGPVLIAAGIAAFLATRPAPSAGHVAGLAAIALVGGAVGWMRAKLSKVEFDSVSGTVTLRGTPYGILLLVVLFALRSGLRIAAVQHPEWGIDVSHATDFLLFFAFGLVAGYAVELSLAAGRARRQAA